MKMRKHNGNDNRNESSVSDFYKKIRNKKVVVFGAGKTGEFIVKFCKVEFGIDILFFIDNSLKKQSSDAFLNGKQYKVYSLKDAIKLIDENIVIIIASLENEDTICKQLFSQNIKRNAILSFAETDNINADKSAYLNNSDIKIYYFKPFCSSNFGDTLNSVLIPKLFNHNIKRTDKHNCNLISIGSLLHMFTNNAESFDNQISVWGSGFIEPPLICDERFYCKMKFYAVRGNLSKQRVCKMTCCYDDLVVGDPGLLVSRCFKNNVLKKYKFGLIPHFIDYYSEYVKIIMNKYDDVLLIDVTEKIEDILLKICSCETIISSSLHGLIAADSFNIPNIWVKFSDDIIGGDYKFKDYYSVFNLDNTISAFNLREKALPINLYSYIKENYMVQAQKVIDIQNDLYCSFPYKESV